MKKKIIKIILHLAFLISIFIGGYFLGKKQKVSCGPANLFTDFLHIKDVSYISGILQGDVTKISGRELSLKVKNKIVTLHIPENVVIEKIIFPENINFYSILKEGKLSENIIPERKSITLEEIKTGDNALVSFEITPTGILEVKRITLSEPIK